MRQSDELCDVAVEFIKRIVCVTFALFAAYARAGTLYVDGTQGNDGNSGASWSLAKKTLASAYKAAADEDVILVADGTYGRINVNGEKRITIRSVNGAAHATIDGGGTSRCASFYYSDWSTPFTDVVVDGFTLTGGYREGSGGAAYGGTFRNCRIIGNKCTRSGGAGYGANMDSCTIISNVAGNCAGAVYDGKIDSCVVMHNVATNWGGAFYGCRVRNSIIAGNYCGKTGGGVYEGTLIGCSVFANSAGTGTAGAYNPAATNTVLWANQKVGGITSNWSKGTYGHCVLYPNVEGEANTDRDPLLYSVENFDGRLCENSSCIDAGDNSIVVEIADAIGNPRIVNNTVDIGACEGAVDGTGGRIGASDKVLLVAPGEGSSFTLDDGGKAVIFGVSPLMKSDFVAQGSSGELRYDNRNLIDAEKSALVSVDDNWCQHMTEINLTVWGGWSDYVGFTNEDDFAESLRKNRNVPENTCVLDWVMGQVPDEYAYDDYVKWTWFRYCDVAIQELIDRTADNKCWTYLQMDWVTPGTTNIFGSHAVTCCGYALDPSYTAGTPQSLKGLFIINGDEYDENSGQPKPNSICYYPVKWDAEHKKFMLQWAAGFDGMLRFLCYLYARPYSAYGEATVKSPCGAIPYSWLAGHGLFTPGQGVSAETAANLYWRDYVAGTDPNDTLDNFHATISVSNGQVKIGWMPDLGAERKYTVYGRASLTDEAGWHAPASSTDCFFTVNVEMRNPITVGGYGVISESKLMATNRYAVYKGKLSLIDENIVDAEKIDSIEVDDLGCGEATGANLSWMLGWAQKAGFASEDDVFRQFYTEYGDLGKTGGVQDVLKFVIGKIAGESYEQYFQRYDGFSPDTFRLIEAGISSGKACGIYFMHGTPQATDGNHVVTLWGVCKDGNYLPTDPRYYAGVIVSDSDDDKTGYATAEGAPNRVKFMPVTWNEAEKVYYISDGYLVRAYIISPP